MCADVWEVAYENRKRHFEDGGMYGPLSFFLPEPMHPGDLYEELAPRRKMVEGDLYA